MFLSCSVNQPNIVKAQRSVVAYQELLPKLLKRQLMPSIESITFTRRIEVIMKIVEYGSDFADGYCGKA
uniref:Uncharacterized protein n=1 Tax=Parascaris equorum TaxID=6256 RepID=A0A914RYQ5_PAREQ